MANQLVKALSSLLPTAGAVAGGFIPIPGVNATVGPWIGRGLGALAGTGLSSLVDWLGGSQATPQSAEQVQRFNPQQQNVMQQLLNMGMQRAQNPGLQASFEPIAAAATNRFQQQAVPSIMERLNSLSHGQNTSAMPQVLGSAFADLQRDLAAQQQGFNLTQQGLQNAQTNQMLGMGLTPQFDTMMRPREQSGAEMGFANLSSMIPLLALLLSSGGISAGGKA